MSKNSDVSGYLPLPCVLTWPLGMNAMFSTPFTSKSSSVTWDDRVVSVQSGTTTDGYSLFESNMIIHLSHRDVNTIEYSVKFDDPQVGRDTFVGMGNTERGIFFGYADDVFGMKVIIGGSREYARLYVQSAPTANGLITISIGGRTVYIGIGLGMTAGQVMAVIAYSSALTAQNIRARSMCDKVELYTVEAEDYSSTPPTVNFGTTGVTGYIELSKSGTPSTVEFIPVSDFNCSAGLSVIHGWNLSSWNVFRIKFNMWSAGGIELAVLNNKSCEFINIHEWRPSTPTERFETTVPYCTSLNVYTSDAATVTSAAGVMVVGGSVMNGIPATAGLRGRFSKMFIKTDVATSAAGDSAVGVLGCPVVQDGGVRNTGIGTVYKIVAVVKSTVDVVCSAIINGIPHDSFSCSRVLPWTCLDYSNVVGLNTVYSGMLYTSAFIAAGDQTQVDMEIDGAWLTPGSFLILCVRAAHAADVGTTLECVTFTAYWWET